MTTTTLTPCVVDNDAYDAGKTTCEGKWAVELKICITKKGKEKYNCDSANMDAYSLCAAKNEALTLCKPTTTLFQASPSTTMTTTTTTSTTMTTTTLTPCVVDNDAYDAGKTTCGGKWAVKLKICITKKGKEKYNCDSAN